MSYNYKACKDESYGDAVATPVMERNNGAWKVRKRYRRHHKLLERTVSRNAAGRITYPTSRLEVPTVTLVVEAPPNLPGTKVVNGDDFPVREVDVKVDLMKVDLDEANPTTTVRGFRNYSVLVRSRAPGDVSVMYNIKCNETFEAIYEDYAERFDLKTRQIRMWKWSDNKIVHPTSKPEDVGIRTANVLFVLGEPGVVNLNMRIKVFFITEVSRDPVEIRVQGTHNTSLSRMFHLWGAKAKVNPIKIVLMHEKQYLTTVYTIKDAKN